MGGGAEGGMPKVSATLGHILAPWPKTHRSESSMNFPASDTWKGRA